MKGIIGKKIGMTQVFREDGEIVPVTVVEAGPCIVVQIKQTEGDGYDSIQLGFIEKKESKVNRPLGGHFKKHETSPFSILKEFRVDDASAFRSGHVITVEQFRPGERVQVTGRSKGRGFAGVMKRHGFKGSQASHGTHEYFRHGGSIGAAAYPSRVFKGKKMPGQYGNKQITVKNIQVVDVHPSENLILLKGAISGPNKSIVIIKGEGPYELPIEAEEQG